MAIKKLEERIALNRKSLSPEQKANRVGLAATGAKATGQNVQAAIPAGFQTAGKQSQIEQAFQTKSAAEHRLPSQIDRLADSGVDPNQALAALRGTSDSQLAAASNERIQAIRSASDVKSAEQQASGNVGMAQFNATGRERATDVKMLDTLNDSIFDQQSMIDNERNEKAKLGHERVRNSLIRKRDALFGVSPEGGQSAGGNDTTTHESANQAAKSSGATFYTIGGEKFKVQ